VRELLPELLKLLLLAAPLGFWQWLYVRKQKRRQEEAEARLREALADKAHAEGGLTDAQAQQVMAQAEHTLAEAEEIRLRSVQQMAVAILPKLDELTGELLAARRQLAETEQLLGAAQGTIQRLREQVEKQAGIITKQGAQIVDLRQRLEAVEGGC